VVKVFGKSIIRTDSDPAQGFARRRAQYRDGHEHRTIRMDPYQNLTETEVEILQHIHDGGSHYFGNVANALGLDIDFVSQTSRRMVRKLSHGKRRGASADNLRYIANVAKSRGLI